jgi:hypothetical protein
MYWVEKTLFPPAWEKNTYDSESERFVPPYLFLINRAYFTGLLFFNGNTKRKKSFAFAYISLYFNKNGERVCRIDRLTFLNNIKEDKIKILNEIIKIAKQIYGKIDIFEAEIFIDVNSSIFFPSTLFILGSCNKKEVLNLYRDMDFELIKTKCCYEIDLNSVNICKVPNAQINMIKPEEWSNYWNLWGMTDDCSNTSYILKANIGASYGDLFPFLSNPSYILMYKQFGSIFGGILNIPICQGFVQWAPNIHKFLLQNNKINLEKINHSYFKEAKIFKISLKVKDDYNSANLYGNMIDLSLSFLKSKGIIKCQVGNFEQSHPVLVHIKKKYSGKCAYTVGIFQKRI